MNKFLFSAATLAFVIAAPASAQILGGGGPLGGGVGGTIGGTIDTRLPRVERVLPDQQVRRGGVVDRVTRIGERPIVNRRGSRADILRTRGVVAANRRGMKRVNATRTGVQVFVPSVILPAPSLPNVVVRPYPAYSSSYYYGPNAVYVDHRYADDYMDRQYRDIEVTLEDSGATVERRGDTLVILLPADVTFAFDRSEIRPRFYDLLAEFAETLRNYPGTDVEVVGHTDSMGSEAYNIGLSERRGRSVADFLVARGVEPSRLVVEAMGESDPIASNASESGRAANRRVELIIHPRAG